MKKQLIRLTENELHKIIKESVNQIINNVLLNEKRNIQSQKLYNILKQHGGIAKAPSQHHNYVACLDFHNLQDEDIIGVFDYQDVRSLGNLSKDFITKHNVHLDMADTLDKIELADGKYLVAILRGGRYDRINAPNREKMLGDFEEKNHKTREREKNKRYRRGEYNWVNKKAQELFTNPFFRNNKGGWTKDEKMKAMDDARSFQK